MGLEKSNIKSKLILFTLIHASGLIVHDSSFHVISMKSLSCNISLTCNTLSADVYRPSDSRFRHYFNSHCGTEHSTEENHFLAYSTFCFWSNILFDSTSYHGSKMDVNAVSC